MDNGLSMDNVISSLTSSTNNLSENEGHGMGLFPKIHPHMSGEKGIFVNGYLVETANGVVAIDSALTASESKALKAELDSINTSSSCSTYSSASRSRCWRDISSIT
jgi:hypothetical protein